MRCRKCKNDVMASSSTTPLTTSTSTSESTTTKPSTSRLRAALSYSHDTYQSVRREYEIANRDIQRSIKKISQHLASAQSWKSQYDGLSQPELLRKYAFLHDDSGFTEAEADDPDPDPDDDFYNSTPYRVAEFIISLILAAIVTYFVVSAIVAALHPPCPTYNGQVCNGQGACLFGNVCTCSNALYNGFACEQYALQYMGGVVNQNGVPGVGYFIENILEECDFCISTPINPCTNGTVITRNGATAGYNNPDCVQAQLAINATFNNILVNAITANGEINSTINQMVAEIAQIPRIAGFVFLNVCFGSLVGTSCSYQGCPLSDELQVCSGRGNPAVSLFSNSTPGDDSDGCSAGRSFSLSDPDVIAQLTDSELEQLAEFDAAILTTRFVGDLVTIPVPGTNANVIFVFRGVTGRYNSEYLTCICQINYFGSVCDLGQCPRNTGSNIICSGNGRTDIGEEFNPSAPFTITQTVSGLNPTVNCIEGAVPCTATNGQTCAQLPLDDVHLYDETLLCQTSGTQSLTNMFRCSTGKSVPGQAAQSVSTDYTQMGFTVGTLDVTFIDARRKQARADPFSPQSLAQFVDSFEWPNSTIVQNGITNASLSTFSSPIVWLLFDVVLRGSASATAQITVNVGASGTVGTVWTLGKPGPATLYEVFTQTPGTAEFQAYVALDFPVTLSVSTASTSLGQRVLVYPIPLLVAPDWTNIKLLDPLNQTYVLASVNTFITQITTFTQPFSYVLLSLPTTSQSQSQIVASVTNAASGVVSAIALSQCMSTPIQCAMLWNATGEYAFTNTTPSFFACCSPGTTYGFSFSSTLTGCNTTCSSFKENITPFFRAASVQIFASISTPSDAFGVGSWRILVPNTGPWITNVTCNVSEGATLEITASEILSSTNLQSPQVPCPPIASLGVSSSMNRSALNQIWASSPKGSVTPGGAFPLDVYAATGFHLLGTQVFARGLIVASNPQTTTLETVEYGIVVTATATTRQISQLQYAGQGLDDSDLSVRPVRCPTGNTATLEVVSTPVIESCACTYAGQQLATTCVCTFTSCTCSFISGNCDCTADDAVFAATLFSELEEIVGTTTCALDPSAFSSSSSPTSPTTSPTPSLIVPFSGNVYTFASTNGVLGFQLSSSVYTYMENVTINNGTENITETRNVTSNPCLFAGNINVTAFANLTNANISLDITTQCSSNILNVWLIQPQFPIRFSSLDVFISNNASISFVGVVLLSSAGTVVPAVYTASSFAQGHPPQNVARYDSQAWISFPTQASQSSWIVATFSSRVFIAGVSLDILQGAVFRTSSIDGSIAPLAVQMLLEIFSNGQWIQAATWVSHAIPQIPATRERIFVPFLVSATSIATLQVRVSSPVPMILQEFLPMSFSTCIIGAPSLATNSSVQIVPPYQNYVALATMSISSIVMIKRTQVIQQNCTCTNTCSFQVQGLFVSTTHANQLPTCVDVQNFLFTNGLSYTTNASQIPAGILADLCPTGSQCAMCGPPRNAGTLPGIGCGFTMLEDEFIEAFDTDTAFSEGRTLSDFVTQPNGAVQIQLPGIPRIAFKLWADCPGQLCPNGTIMCVDGSCGINCDNVTVTIPGNGCLQSASDVVLFGCACQIGINGKVCEITSTVGATPSVRQNPYGIATSGGPPPPQIMFATDIVQAPLNPYTIQELIDINLQAHKQAAPIPIKLANGTTVLEQRDIDYWGVQFRFDPFNPLTQYAANLATNGDAVITNCPPIRMGTDYGQTYLLNDDAIRDPVTGIIVAWREYLLANGSLVTYPWANPFWFLDKPYRCATSAQCVPDASWCPWATLAYPLCNSPNGISKPDGTCQCAGGFTSTKFSAAFSYALDMPYGPNDVFAFQPPQNNNWRLSTQWCDSIDCNQVSCLIPIGCFPGSFERNFEDALVMCSATSSLGSFTDLVSTVNPNMMRVDQCASSQQACVQGTTTPAGQCNNNGIWIPDDYQVVDPLMAASPFSQYGQCLCCRSFNNSVPIANVTDATQCIRNGFGPTSTFSRDCGSFYCQQFTQNPNAVPFFLQVDASGDAFTDNGVAIPGLYQGPCGSPMGAAPEDVAVWQQGCNQFRFDRCVNQPCLLGGSTTPVFIPPQQCFVLGGTTYEKVCNGHGTPTTAGLCICDSGSGFQYGPDPTRFSRPNCFKKYTYATNPQSNTACGSITDARDFSVWNGLVRDPSARWLDDLTDQLLVLSGRGFLNSTWYAITQATPLSDPEDYSALSSPVTASLIQAGQSAIIQERASYGCVCVVANDNCAQPFGMRPYCGDAFISYKRGYDDTFPVVVDTAVLIDAVPNIPNGVASVLIDSKISQYMIVSPVNASNFVSVLGNMTVLLNFSTPITLSYVRLYSFFGLQPNGIESTVFTDAIVTITNAQGQAVCPSQQMPPSTQSSDPDVPTPFSWANIFCTPIFRVFDLWQNTPTQAFLLACGSADPNISPTPAPATSPIFSSQCQVQSQTACNALPSQFQAVYVTPASSSIPFGCTLYQCCVIVQDISTVPVSSIIITASSLSGGSTWPINYLVFQEVEIYGSTGGVVQPLAPIVAAELEFRSGNAVPLSAIETPELLFLNVVLPGADKAYVIPGNGSGSCDGPCGPMDGLPTLVTYADYAKTCVAYGGQPAVTINSALSTSTGSLALGWQGSLYQDDVMASVLSNFDISFPTGGGVGATHVAAAWINLKNSAAILPINALFLDVLPPQNDTLYYHTGEYCIVRGCVSLFPSSTITNNGSRLYFAAEESLYASPWYVSAGFGTLPVGINQITWSSWISQYSLVNQNSLNTNGYGGGGFYTCLDGVTNYITNSNPFDDTFVKCYIKSVYSASDAWFNPEPGTFPAWSPTQAVADSTTFIDVMTARQAVTPTVYMNQSIALAAFIIIKGLSSVNNNGILSFAAGPTNWAQGNIGTMSYTSVTPTNSPSASPTVVPPNIIISATATTYFGGDIGTQLEEYDICVDNVQAGCVYIWPILYYSNWDLYSATTIPLTTTPIPNAPVVGNNGKLPLSTTWSNFAFPGFAALSNTIEDAVVDISTSQVWTGAQTTGAVGNCVDWSQITGGLESINGVVDTTSAEWQINTNDACSNAHQFLCACYVT